VLTEATQEGCPVSVTNPPPPSQQPEDELAFLREIVRRTRREQGLPEAVEDPALLARLASLLFPRE